jgi:hypothetical protein
MSVITNGRELAMSAAHASFLHPLAMLSISASTLLAGNGAEMHCKIGEHGTSYSVAALALSDGYLYAAAGETVHVFDVADPTNPTPVGAFVGLTQAADIEVVDGYAFVLDFADGLITLDLSDPANPIQIDAYDIINGALYNELATDGYTLAIAAGVDGTLFLDVSDPSFAILADQYFRASAYPIGVWMFEGLTFTESWSGGIGIFDAWNPYDPQLILPEYISLNDIAVVGNTLYGLPTFGYNDRVWISDISDPSDPELISMTNSPWVSIVGSHIVVDDERMYYTVDGGSIYELDVSDPVLPKFVQNYPIEGYITDMIVDGDLMYVGNNTPGIAIIDLSDDCADCLADISGNGVADIFDVFAFLDGYLAEDIASDFNRNGYLDINDVFYFLELFNAGCP